MQRSSKEQECLKGAGMFNGGMFIGFRGINTVQGCSKSIAMFNGMLIESCVKGAGMFHG